VEKYSRTRQTADDNIRPRQDIVFLLDNIHALRIFNAYWFSTAAMVTRTRLNVALHVQYIACLAINETVRYELNL